MGKKKFLNQTDMKIGLIGDEDTVTGMVLAGVGHVYKWCLRVHGDTLNRAYVEFS